MEATNTRERQGGRVTLHAFCSVKGGVGKSSLAVACAKLLAESGRRCVLIDADLTGTSLADGLRLCAPDVATRADGGLDLEAAPRGGHLSREQTLALRKARSKARWEDVPPPPPFLNDVLIHGYEKRIEGWPSIEECAVEALLWRHERDDGVLYLPSSPLRSDVEIALGWLYREPRYTWIQRMTWLLEGMREQMSSLTDVVLDLPPGVFGFSQEVLALLSHLAQGEPLPAGFPESWVADRWEGRPFLVTTQDRNDLLVAMEYWVQHRAELPGLVPLVNKRTEGLESIRDAVREHFGPALGDAAAQMLAPIDELRSTLGALFTGAGDLSVTPELRALRASLRLDEEAQP